MSLSVHVWMCGVNMTYTFVAEKYFILYNKHSFKCVGDRLAIQIGVGNNLLTNTLEKQTPTFGNDPMPTLFSKITLLNDQPVYRF